MRGKCTLIHCWWECELVQPLWKTVQRYFRNLNIDLPCDPAILLLGIYPKEKKTAYEKVICTPMFIDAQFTIAKIWNKPDVHLLKARSRDCGIHTLGNNTQHLKKCEILSFTTKWMQLETTIFIDIRQSQEDKYQVFFLICGNRVPKR